MFQVHQNCASLCCICVLSLSIKRCLFPAAFCNIKVSVYSGTVRAARLDVIAWKSAVHVYIDFDHSSLYHA